MRKTAIVALLVVLVIAVGWYEGFYKGETSHISNLRTAEQSAQSKVLTLDSKYSELEATAKQVPTERRYLAELGKLVPNGPELDALETMLGSDASKAGVHLVGVTSPMPTGLGTSAVEPVGATGVAAGPAQLSLDVGVTGTPAQMSKFYDVLTTGSRLIVIDNCVLGLAPKSASKATLAPATETIDLRAFFASTTASSAASPVATAGMSKSKNSSTAS